MTVEERIWNKVDKKGECWLWTGCKNQDGYGRFKIAGSLVSVHRLVYELYKGSIPEGICVLHSCDIPNCVRPEHLSLGTHSDNMQDMYRKFRHGNGKPTTCHPDRKYHAKGLCQECYLRSWREAHATTARP